MPGVLQSMGHKELDTERLNWEKMDLELDLYSNSFFFFLL